MMQGVDSCASGPARSIRMPGCSPGCSLRSAGKTSSSRFARLETRTGGLGPTAPNGGETHPWSEAQETGSSTESQTQRQALREGRVQPGQSHRRKDRAFTEAPDTWN